MFNFCAGQINENLPRSQFISLFQIELSLLAETIKLKKERIRESKTAKQLYLLTLSRKSGKQAQLNLPVVSMIMYQLAAASEI